jgi:hypothetical protein
VNTSFQQRLRTDLREAADSIVSSPPPFDRSKYRRRRRRFIAIGAAGLVVVGGGVAIAARLIPHDVQRSNDRMSETGACGTVLTDQAHMVASAPRADGNRLELWITPTSTGNIATSLRIVRPDGTFNGDTGGCGVDNPKSWAGASSDIADGQSEGTVDIYGRTDPGATRARVTFYSGTVVTVDVQTDGYFVHSLTDDVTKYQQVKVVEPVG